MPERIIKSDGKEKHRWSVVSRKRKDKRKRRRSSKHVKNKGTTIKSSKTVIDQPLPNGAGQEIKDLRNDEILNLQYDRSVIKSKTSIFSSTG